MAKLKELNNYGTKLRNQLLLKTFPIAIKLLKKETEIPQEAIRPRRDLNHHLALCQSFAMSRREKSTVAMLKEDHWCYVPVIALGHAETPEFVLEGNMGYPSELQNWKQPKILPGVLLTWTSANSKELYQHLLIQPRLNRI